jgi:hypothetical protein
MSLNVGSPPEKQNEYSKGARAVVHQQNRSAIRSAAQRLTISSGHGSPQLFPSRIAAPNIVDSTISHQSHFV